MAEKKPPHNVRSHGIPAACVMIVAIVGLVVIQVSALEHGVNGTLLMFTVCTIGALAAGFVGFKISDWRK